jgi:glutamine synthetase
VDIKFTDLYGQWHHFSLPAVSFSEAVFEEGLGFDGSSIRGFKTIEVSDMVLLPDPTSAFMDPACAVPTLSLIADVREPLTREPFSRDPRQVAKKAVEYLKSTGIADAVFMGPEAEFFVFDSVSYETGRNFSKYEIDSSEAPWNSGQKGAGHKIGWKGGYFPVAPFDQLQDLRSEMVRAMLDAGIDVEVHHHEVATAGQCEIDMRFGPLVRMADQVQLYKYIVKNVAAKAGKTATFMPKPIWNDNGSGLHMILSLWKDDHALFSGSGYGGLSETAMFAIGGLLQHAPSLLAFCCPTTNSYKRLTPGFEAPVNLSYSYRNRSAAIRIPANSGHESKRRFEFRCPDSACNPYLAMSAILMAMLDGIQNRVSPGRPQDKDLYDLAPEERAGLTCTPASLEAALDALEKDHDYLLRGDVFTPDVIERWIQHKREEEVKAISQRPHPYEFSLYFDC